MISSIVNIVGIGSTVQVSALTDIQKQQCFNKFNNKDLTLAPESDIKLADACRAAATCDWLSDVPDTAPIMKCTDIATAAAEAASAAAAEALVAPLITAVCGTGNPSPVIQPTTPTIFNESPAYRACSNKVVADYNNCAMSRGPSSKLNTPTDAAKCFVGLGNKISLNNAAAAIITGRAAGDAIKSKAATDKATADCIVSGKVIIGGKCVTKPVDPAPKSTCTIDGIGWIVCPVMKFMGDITDMAFNFLASNFLETKVNVVTAPATVNAWSVMRNLANVAFVIAFLIIIFSQLSSVGITNYGVKKMLPRLVVAALLVNLSYFICQIAVDVSNILGYSLKSIFDGFQHYTQAPDAVTQSANGNGWGIAVMVTGLIAGGVTLAFAISVPVLLAALLALMLIVMILFARTALIVLLIVIAPLAFVAYLLPNTEQYFKKWYKMFTGLLLVFPIIAVVVGAAGLAAGILKEAAGDDKMLQVVAMGVATIPLFVVPGLLKNAMAASGAIGAKLSGISSKMNGRVNSKGKQAFGDSRLGQYKKYRAGESAQRRALIQSGTYEGRGGKLNPLNRLSSLNKRINESARSGKFGDRSSSQGNALQDAEDAELVKNAGSRLDYFDQPNGNPLSQAQMIQIATGQDVTALDENGVMQVVSSAKTFDVHARKAAIQRSAKIATVAEAQTLVDASGKDSSGKDMMTAGERLTLVSSMAGSSAVAKAPYLGGETFGDITQGRASTNESARRALEKGKINAEALAGGDKDSVKKMVDAAKLTAADSIERANLKAAYKEYLAAPRLHERVVDGGAHDIQLVSIDAL